MKASAWPLAWLRRQPRGVLLSLLLAMAVFWLAPRAGQAQPALGPVIRVDIQAKQPVLVGAQVPIAVTVVAPNFFLSAPPFPTLDVQGAIITMPDDRGVHDVQQQGGQTLATISKTYVFTAQQAGDFTLPQVKIEFSYQGNDDRPQQANLVLPATRIRAQLPAGAAATAAAGAAAMPATRLVARQQLDRDATKLAAGDALVRTVEIQAANAPAMLIPPPHFEAPAGVRMYAADPVLQDSNGEGGGFAGGRRIERITYVFQDAGHYTLPAVQLKWLDPQTRHSETASAPAIRVQVASGAHLGERIAPQLPVGAPAAPREPVHWLRMAAWLLAAALVGLAAVLVVRKGWPAWRRRKAALQAAQAQGDDAMFDRVLAACRTGDARDAHRALLVWCRDHAQATPAAWATQLGDEALMRQLESLGQHLFRSPSAGTKDWNGGECAAVLQQAHQAWRAQARAHAPRRVRGRGLGPLNPFETQA